MRLALAPRLFPLALLAFSACAREASPPPAPSATKPPPPASRPGPTAEAPEYAVTIVGPGSATVGAEAAARITITARAGLKVNQEYPVAFRPEGHEGVRFGDGKVKLTLSELEPCPGKPADACAAKATLPFVPERAGASTVAGVLQFSVCDAERCLIEKAALALPVTAQ